MERLIKNKRGVTLVALVITIIVLLILAGISIGTLTNSGLFENSKLAKEEYANAQKREEIELAKYSNEIDSYVDGNRGTVTIPQEEYEKLKRKGYTLLWTGNGDKIGNADSAGNEYKYINSNMDVENYDFILIEFAQSNSNHKGSVLINSDFITKSASKDISCQGYGDRYITMHFVNNGFSIDERSISDTVYINLKNIYGINM